MPQPPTMTNDARSLTDIMALLEQARGLLAKAESAWPAALANEAAGRPLPEAALLEELMHQCSHETASALALSLADIQTLVARIRLRQRYRMFALEMFESIVSSGWSAALAAELQRKMPEFTLGEVSELVKNLYAEWTRLPRLMAFAAPVHNGAAP